MEPVAVYAKSTPVAELSGGQSQHGGAVEGAIGVDRLEVDTGRQRRGVDDDLILAGRHQVEVVVAVCIGRGVENLIVCGAEDSVEARPGSGYRDATKSEVAADR